MPASASPWVLRVFRGGRALFDRPIDKDVLSIGVNDRCDIVLEGAEIARFHALIERAPSFGRCWVKSISFGGSVHVNGAKVYGSASLKDGDEIQIGEYAIRAMKDAPANRTPRRKSSTRMRRPSDLGMVLVPTEDGELAAIPLAPVIWSATAEEMSSVAPTGEVAAEPILAPASTPHAVEMSPRGEPIFLLTQRKSAPPHRR
jgi:hypothetical protein